MFDEIVSSLLMRLAFANVDLRGAMIKTSDRPGIGCACGGPEIATDLLSVSVSQGHPHAHPSRRMAAAPERNIFHNWPL